MPFPCCSSWNKQPVTASLVLGRRQDIPGSYTIKHHLTPKNDLPTDEFASSVLG